MADVKVTLNRAAIRALLTSAEVERDLRQRAERINGAAGGGHTVDSSTTGNRARAAVIADTPETMLAEARSGSLTAALDAGR
jgi:hypothetical protein